ncbi:type II toxin-antitoxin system VapC family toxin [Novosphingobium mangrovi (ex Huang et al. 2023)]|uniref:Ribonuclease VapC n=1 Tax=Novosphingobium mangrovi (ex Huang et al. 2023) TaxID=2976432 RepID=A0ABT2I474_9SPHN|nr:type II toxin-antitoxin system VapC family toxin [Novosphingobium mangrovi (ex Huang et al. 2023)]MCT2399600.1 type II toxin-antitoxin system VapC family toxin [Novosphingobium mangrovi (ex Huang et al. 2023)]
MSFLLDTNVISEGARPRPDPGVMDWLASMDEEQLFLSVVSLAELRHGIERLDDGGRKAALDVWLTEQLAPRFEERLLLVDPGTADQWGRVVARTQSAGRPIGAMDAFLAAHALQHQLTLVTRNVSDFEAAGVRLFNPWTEGKQS